MAIFLYQSLLFYVISYSVIVECLSPAVKSIELSSVDEVTAAEKQIKLLLIRLFKMASCYVLLAH